MESITKYKSNDGETFDTAEEAVEHEGMLLSIEEVKKFIIINPDGNSTVGIKNTKENVIKFKEEFRKLLQEYSPSCIEKWDVNERGLQGYIRDGLWGVYYNFLSIGSDNKSYGQPAFATQSNRGQTVGVVAGGFI